MFPDSVLPHSSCSTPLTSENTPKILDSPLENFYHLQIGLIYAKLQRSNLAFLSPYFITTLLSQCLRTAGCLLFLLMFKTSIFLTNLCILVVFR